MDAKSLVLRGSGFGGQPEQPKPPTRTPDSLFSTDLLEAILAISEGPIKGFVDGAKSFYAGDTPFMAPDGSPNTSNFELHLHTGGNPGSSIQPRLGGVGSSTSAGVELYTNVPVVRRGQLNDIDAIEVRIVINRLVRIDDEGDYADSGTFRVEYKPASAAVWNNPFAGTVRPTEQIASGHHMIYGPATDAAGRLVNPSRRQVFIQTTYPTQPTGVKPVWFNSANNLTPTLWSGTEWFTPQGLVYGTQAASAFGPAYPYWQWLEDGQVRHAYIGYLGMPPYGMGQFDIWVTPGGFGTGGPSGQVLIYNGSSWVAPTNPVPAVTPGDVTITGKTTASYVKEIRIPVPRISEPYDIRVTKISPINTTQYFFDVSFESFQELRNDPLVFDDLACAHFIVKASDQFSSIPQFTSECYGRLIRVPTNFNPVTKAYTGIWDGTFKIEYTDDPAWIVYDLVMNDRYGMNSYRPVFLDKYAVYEFSKHCALYGFTFNDWIQDPRSITEAVNYVCGIAGGRLIDQEDGYATILFDSANSPAVALFTPENIVDGTFIYSFTDVAARKNDITVSFINPDLNWREDRRRVFDTDRILRNGRVAEEFIAVGCIDEEEAIKRARLRLATASMETTIVNFKTNRVGLYIKPFDVILVADQDANKTITGRLKPWAIGFDPLAFQPDAFQQEAGSRDEPNDVYLRDPVFLEAGFTYYLKVQIPKLDGSGFTVFTTQIVSPPGSHHGLLVNPQLPILPDEATYSIECEDLNAVPKAFRITSIEEGENPDDVTITAVEVYRNKWDYVAGTINLPAVKGSGRVTTFVYPVNNLRLIPQTTSSGQHQFRLQWDDSITPLLKFYRIRMSVNGGPDEVIGETRQNSFVFGPAQTAYYRFTVVAVNAEGQESAPMIIEHEVAGDLRTVEPPSNLRLVNETAPYVFQSLAPHFRWTGSRDPFLSHYLVEMLNPNTDVVIRDERIFGGNTEYTYDFDSNLADGLRRDVKIRVRAADLRGSLSAPITLVVSNPPPVAIYPTVTAGFENLFVQYVTPDEPDFRGVLIWVGDTVDFVANADSLVYDGPNTFITLQKTEGTYFVKIAGYDAFGKTGLNVSQSIEVFVGGLNLDFTPPAIPTGLSLTTRTETLPTGVTNTIVAANVAVSPSENFATFEFEIREGSGTYLGFLSGSNYIEWSNLRAGATYTVRARAQAGNGRFSGWSATEGIVASTKTTGPAAPTALTAQASFQNIFLSWTNPADKDIDFVEVWEHTSNTRASATRIGTVKGTNFTRSGLTTGVTRWYWVRAVNTSGVVGAWNATAGLSVTTTSVTGGDIVQNAIDATKFAAGVEPVSVVSALPAPLGYTGPKTVLLTTDGKLYRYVSGAWTSSLAAIDVTGQITSTQITDSAISTIKLAANAITAEKLAANSVVAGKIAAGAVSADQITANAITASKLFLGDTSNLYTDYDLIDPDLYSSPDGAVYSFFNTAVANRGQRTLRINVSAVDATVESRWMQTEISADYYAEVSMNLATAATGGTVEVFVELATLASNGVATPTRMILVGTRTNSATTTRLGTTFTTSNAERRFRFVFKRQGGSSHHGDFGGPLVRRRASGQLIVDGAITAEKITANAITADKILGGTITGDKFNTSTSLPGTISVGTTGVTIQTLTNPAALVNSGATTIDPGKILISGSTTLASWRNGTDATKIEGGALATNTVSANKVEIGLRGIEIAGLEFWNVNNILYWSAGTISYTNDAGVTATHNITAGNVTWTSATVYIAWGKGATVLKTSTTRYTGADDIILCTYRGSSNYVANYGRTIIDGAHIKTETITSNLISANAIIAGKIAANAISAATIQANAVTADKIIANAVTADKIAANSITAVKIQANAITADKINVTSLSAVSANMGTITAGYMSGPNGRMVFDLSNNVMKIFDTSGVLRVKIGNLLA